MRSSRPARLGYWPPVLPMLVGLVVLAAAAIALVEVGVFLPARPPPPVAGVAGHCHRGRHRAPPRSADRGGRHGRATAVAYTPGTFGALIGADLLNLRRVRGLGAPVASIGGAGTFDGIFITGILAVVLASI